ncbi:MAG: DUF726 domain-containing protein [Candidatus Nanopelagicales bacterium]
MARGSAGYVVTLTTARGHTLTLTGSVADQSFDLSGHSALSGNETVVTGLTAYARHEHLRRRSRSVENRESHDRAATQHSKIATRVADHVEELGDRTREGWCSSCFRLSEHRKVDDRTLVPPVFLCGLCGGPTTPCFAPRCPHMANRRTGTARLPRYCAEHRHDIPAFDKLASRLTDLEELPDWLAFERRNLAAATKVTAAAGVAAVVLAPAALLAAPAIGGALGGSMLGGSLSGAAATSHGLAMLGGGALGSGPLAFGMLGGTVVVTAAGAALGGSLGAAATSAYVRDDSSFKIVKLRDGDGPAVLLASGFLTEKDDGWGSWRRIIDDRYLHAPVYRVFWGSKELGDVWALLGSTGSKAAIARATAQAAMRGSRKAAAKVPWLMAPFLAHDLAANPWMVAKNRAEMTGAALADILARTDQAPYVLVGHSLGARVMATAAAAMSTMPGTARLESVHLLGAAIAAESDHRALGESVTGIVWNYFSSRDKVLAAAYRAAQLRQQAAGSVGLRTKQPRIKNVDLSRQVTGHSDYFEKAALR